MAFVSEFFGLLTLFFILIPIAISLGAIALILFVKHRYDGLKLVNIPKRIGNSGKDIPAIGTWFIPMWGRSDGTGSLFMLFKNSVTIREGVYERKFRFSEIKETDVLKSIVGYDAIVISRRISVFS